MCGRKTETRRANESVCAHVYLCVCARAFILILVFVAVILYIVLFCVLCSVVVVYRFRCFCSSLLRLCFQYVIYALIFVVHSDDFEQFFFSSLHMLQLSFVRPIRSFICFRMFIRFIAFCKRVCLYLLVFICVRVCVCLLL